MNDFSLYHIVQKFPRDVFFPLQIPYKCEQVLYALFEEQFVYLHTSS